MAQKSTWQTLNFLLRLHVLAVFLVLFAPIIVMILFSFDGTPIPIYPIENPTIEWYGQIFGERAADYWDPLVNSLFVAFLTSILATTIGALAAFGLSRYDPPGNSVLPYVLATPALIPPIVTGFGLLIFLRQYLGADLSLFTVVLGHTVLTMPFAAFIVATKLGPEVELERAARDLGANYRQMITEVTLPMIAPALVASFLIAFAISLGESAMVFMIRGPESLLPVEIQSRVATQFTPRVNAISTVTIFITVGVLAIAEFVRQKLI